MKYKGIELKEVTEPQLFDTPKKMLVWDVYNECPSTAKVCAIINRYDNRVITENAAWRHCAEIPKALEQKPVTRRELARWLAQGNGEVNDGNSVYSRWEYFVENENKAINNGMVVRKWDEIEWHKPTREYLGLEDR